MNRVPPMFPANDSIPLVIGYQYRIGSSDMWVEIYALDTQFVYARGVGNTISDLKEPRWKFDDLVGAYRA